MTIQHYEPIRLSCMHICQKKRWWRKQKQPNHCPVTGWGQAGDQSALLKCIRIKVVTNLAVLPGRPLGIHIWLVMSLGVFRLGSKPKCVSPPRSFHLYGPIICGQGIPHPTATHIQGACKPAAVKHVITWLKTSSYRWQYPVVFAHIDSDPSPNTPKGIVVIAVG